jgi:hypothetical protein
MGSLLLPDYSVAGGERNKMSETVLTNLPKYGQAISSVVFLVPPGQFHL